MHTRAAVLHKIRATLALLRERLPRWAQAALQRLAPAADPGGGDRGFLPDFCDGRTIINVLVMAELLAVVVTLVTRRISPNLLQDLILISVFIQWIALTSVAVLCGLRRHLNRLPNARALALAYMALLAVTILVTEATVWALWLAGETDSPRPEFYGHFHIQNLTVAAIIDALALRYFFARHALTQRTLSEERAKLQALRSRLRPHFLFSSMNIIASLIRSAPAKAETAIEDMADLFRMMLADDENLVPVRNEIEVAKKYLALEALRLDNRLRLDWDVGKYPRTAVMPVLTLQPLLENAIHHGIEPFAEGGTISTRLWEENDMLHVSVSNPLPTAGSRGRRDSHVGTLEGIRQRLASHYGDSAHLDVLADKNRFTVTLSLPMRGGKP